MAKSSKFSFNTPPIMFAAWPGMGNVALMAMDFLRRTVDAHLFAELDMKPFYVPEEVVVEKGMARFPEIPRSYFHEQHDPNLVFFESTLMTEGKDAVTIAETVLDVARKLKAPRIYTAAALPKAMSFRSDPEVYVAANKHSLLEELQSYGIGPLDDGYISGLSGLLLGIAASRDIEAACILVSIPTYAAGMVYPKGSLAIVEALARINDLKINTGEMEQAIKDSEDYFDDIEERLRNMFPMLMEQEEEEAEEPYGEQDFSQEAERIPEYVMDRIERLFRELSKKKDLHRAQELKAELDKWGLYQIYEDRFLDLFKEED